MMHRTRVDRDEQAYKRLAMGGLRERIVIGGCICGAVAIFAVGGYLAGRSGDPHWFNRAGAAIVALEGVLVTVEFARARRLRRVKRLDVFKDVGGMESEMEKAEWKVLLCAAGFAIFGELCHGFGDVIFGRWV